MKLFALILSLAFSSLSLAADQEATPTMTPDQLKYFPFQQTNRAKPPKVTDLSVGQQFVLKQDRKDVKDLIARHLGIMDLHGDKADLATIQQIIDRGVLKKSQTKQWQEVGVVFGDILANEFDLHWVSYADDKGVSTALQWKNTQNFVFPVTMFSKRVQFDEKLDAFTLYNKIKKDIEDFIVYEKKLPKQ